MLGYVNYGVLVGIPKPVSLHKEDAAWAELLKRGFQTRVTTEGYRLAAARSEGGAQWFGVVPGTVAAVARELKILLLGETQASQMARDELRWAMQEPPGRVDQITGLVTNAMRSLAGYVSHGVDGPHRSESFGCGHGGSRKAEHNRRHGRPRSRNTTKTSRTLSRSETEARRAILQGWQTSELHPQRPTKDEGTKHPNRRKSSSKPVAARLPSSKNGRRHGGACGTHR